MDTPNFDLEKAFEVLHEQFKSVNEQIERYKEDAQTAEERAKAAEVRIVNAERLTTETEEKYRKALELKDGQYEQLIHDLFKAPQEELLGRMENHSKKSFVITMWTAIGSIVVGLVISLVLQNQSSTASQALIRQMEESLKTTNNLIAKIDSVNEDIWAVDERIKDFAQLIDEEGKSLGGYNSKNDVALLFKIHLTKRGFNRTSSYRKGYYNYPMKYGDYIKAFKVSNIPKEYIPIDDAELKRWDLEYRDLCQKALSNLEQKMEEISPNSNITREISSNELVSNTNSNANIFSNIRVNIADRKYSSYKSESDETYYGELTWKNFEYPSLIFEIRAELARINRRIDLN